MRLAFLTSQFPYASLGETFFRPELAQLSRLCDEVHVIPARPELRESAFRDGETLDVRLPPLGARTLAAALAESIGHPVAAAKALWRILAPKYNLKAKAKNLALFPKALAAARYVRRNGIEHVHAAWLTTPGTIAYVINTMTGVPWSCTAHAHDIFSGNLLDAKLRSAKFVRVIANRNRAHLAALTGTPVERLHLLHLGVAVPPQAAPVSHGRDLQILCAARLDPIKGHLDLLRALAILRDGGTPFHCDIAGTGPLWDELCAGIERAGLDRFVTMRGLVEHRALLDEINGGAYDVLALASLELDVVGKHAHEGIPVALIESMAAGVPCVATDTGCIPELIDARSGMLVPQRDARAFAGALAKLAQDPALRLRLGDEARRRVIAEFDACATTRRLYDLIQADAAREEAGGHSIPCVVSNPASIPAANAN